MRTTQTWLQRVTIFNHCPCWLFTFPIKCCTRHFPWHIQDNILVWTSFSVVLRVLLKFLFYLPKSFLVYSYVWFMGSNKGFVVLALNYDTFCTMEYHGVLVLALLLWYIKWTLDMYCTMGYHVFFVLASIAGTEKVDLNCGGEFINTETNKYRYKLHSFLVITLNPFWGFASLV